MKISKKLILSFLAVASISILLGSMITFSGSIIIGLVVIVIDIGIVFGLAKFVTGNIVSPLQQAIKIIGEIGSGDTSGSMLMGKAVNCSSFKQCDETSCPSYGKEDHCWVSSGSFAVVKSCPRALKGEDCRTCEIYGAHTEMEELGSTIGALVNYFEERKNLALEIANGDLTKEVKLASEKDSLGKAFQIMINSLKKIIDGVQTASEQIVTGSVQLSSSSQSLSQGASQQAATLEEISSSMFEIGSRANTSNENASQAQMLSNQALDQVKQGNKQMESMLQSMQEIKNTSSSVTKVIKVIDEIAFQTNLLALNAAVEAARAGKYGKGFAVVAEEVRNLAGRSAKAAKETNEMIEKSIKEVENGVKRTDETAAVLEGINAGVEKVNDLVAEIAAASQEQNNNLQEINKGLSSMNDVVQHNSSVAEETAAASEDLSSQARNLQVDLNRFKLKQKIAASEQRGKIPQPVIKSFQSTAPQVTLKQQGKRPQPVIKSLQSPAPKLESQEQVAKKPKRVILLDDDEFGKY